VALGDESSTELSDVRLSYINLGDNYTIANVDTTTISVILKGVSSVIEKVSPADINAYIDLNNLGAGEHDVDVIVEGNDEKVQYTPKTTKVKVQIANK
jgi:YbbR domain-containing protein